MAERRLSRAWFEVGLSFLLIIGLFPGNHWSIPNYYPGYPASLPPPPPPIRIREEGVIERPCCTTMATHLVNSEASVSSRFLAVQSHQKKGGEKGGGASIPSSL